MSKNGIPTTATVETLTAEVRVLMVGNRQITLSVAKQLDEVPLTDIKAFGRVKIGPQWDEFLGVPQTHVIGKDSKTGALAIAKAYPKGTRKGKLMRIGDNRFRQLADWNPEWSLEKIELHKQAGKLPLIVLAGLR